MRVRFENRNRWPLRGSSFRWSRTRPCRPSKPLRVSTAVRARCRSLWPVRSRRSHRSRDADELCEPAFVEVPAGLDATSVRQGQREASLAPPIAGTAGSGVSTRTRVSFVVPRSACPLRLACTLRLYHSSVGSGSPLCSLYSLRLKPLLPKSAMIFATSAAFRRRFFPCPYVSTLFKPLQHGFV